MSSTPTSNQTSRVRQGRYPYPAENVFLVSGLKSSKPASVDFAIDGMVIAARRPDLAIRYFKAVSPTPDAWTLVSCLTLAQMKWMAQKIAFDKDHALSLKEGIFAFGKKRPWAILYAGDGNHDCRAGVVIASSSRTVQAHANSTGAPALGVISEDALLVAIQTMEQTQNGQNKKEKYASDLRGGELLEMLDENIASWSDEKRAKYRRIAQEFDEYQAKV